MNVARTAPSVGMKSQKLGRPSEMTDTTTSAATSGNCTVYAMFTTLSTLMTCSRRPFSKAPPPNIRATAPNTKGNWSPRSKMSEIMISLLARYAVNTPWRKIEALV